VAAVDTSEPWAGPGAWRSAGRRCEDPGEARDRGPPPARRGADERRDRGAFLHQHEDRRDARGQHLRQAPAAESGGGGGVRPAVPGTRPEQL